MADVRINDLDFLASPTNGDMIIIHDVETGIDKKTTYNALVASKIAELRSLIGSPLVASTVAGMTDVDRVYVYTGSETGYTAGNWYFYDGTAWASGGTYNSLAIGDGTVTDAKLIQSGGVLSEVHDIRTALDGTVYPTAGDAVRAQVEEAMESGGGVGKLWSVRDVYNFRQLLGHIKYDSASAGTIAETLLESLESNPEDQGWSRAQIDLFDTLLSYVKYTDPDGGDYADTLIASLKGRPITYRDADEVEY